MIAEHRAEILSAWAEVLDSGRFVGGEHLDAFEHEFAEYLGVRHVVGVSSGTDALTLILRALGIGKGDEVLVPALTFVATAEAVTQAGATPVFTDVDPKTWCMTLETAKPHITDSTAAAIPVHLFGNPAPMEELHDLGLLLVEDACQAAGAILWGDKAGSLGTAAAFSFYPSKNLPCCGDGGAIATDDGELAHTVRLLRHHGSDDGRIHLEVGGTNRLDELQAAVLRVLLPHLDNEVEGRQFAAEGIDGLQQVTYGARSAWHRMVSTSPDVRGRRFYDPPLHQQPSMKPFYRGPLPNAEFFAKRNREVRCATDRSGIVGLLTSLPSLCCGSTTSRTGPSSFPKLAAVRDAKG